MNAWVKRLPMKLDVAVLSTFLNWDASIFLQRCIWYCNAFGFYPLCCGYVLSPGNFLLSSIFYTLPVPSRTIISVCANSHDLLIDFSQSDLFKSELFVHCIHIYFLLKSIFKFDYYNLKYVFHAFLKIYIFYNRPLILSTVETRTTNVMTKYWMLNTCQLCFRVKICHMSQLQATCVLF